MRRRTVRFGALVCGAVLGSFLGGGRGLAQGSGEAQAAREEPGGVDLGNLARLAALERQYGNGGAEEAKSAVQAGYDKKEGFFVQDATGDNVLKLGVFLQFRYTYKGRDTRGDDIGSGEIGGEDDSFFELERARLIARGNVISHNLTYKFMVDGDTDGSGTVKTLDAYIEYWAGEDLGDKDNSSLLGIGFGQFKPYFMRQEATSASKLQMVDRSLTDEFFNIDRNVGVWVRGDVGPVFYAFAVTNGFDSVNVAPAAVDQVPAFVGHLDFNLWGDVKRGEYEEGNIGKKDLFAIGVSGATDQNNNSSGVGGARVKIYQFGVDTQLKFDLLSLQAEYVGRWVDYAIGNGAVPGGDGSAQYAHGFYLQGGILLGDTNLELVGRVSTVWSDGPQKGNGLEVGPGLNWYISGSHKVKLQTDVMWFDLSGGLPDSTEDLDGTLGTTGAGSTASSFNSTAAQLQAGEQGVMWRTQFQLSF